MSKKLSQQEAIEFIKNKIGIFPREFKSQRELARAADVNFENVYKALRGEVKLQQKLLNAVGLIEVSQPLEYEIYKKEKGAIEKFNPKIVHDIAEIKRLRSKAGLTQVKAAELMGVVLNTYKSWESKGNCRRKISDENFKKFKQICEAIK